MRTAFILCVGLLTSIPSLTWANDQASERLKALEAIYGKLSPDELARRVNKDLQQVSARADATKSVIRKAEAAPKSEALRNSYITHALLLRDVYSPVAFISEDSELSTKGASFTYTHNREANERVLAGKGALFLATFGDVNTNLPGTVDPNTNRLTYFSFVPGIEWDISSKNSGKNKGSYAARAGLELEFQGAPISTQYVRANAIFTTDVETSAAKIYGAEVAWQPKIHQLNINTSRQINRNLKMMFGFFPTLNADYFHVGQTASFDNLTKDKDYLWVGPKVLASLYFRKGSPLERFKLEGEYFYLYDAFNGRNTSVDYGRATASVKLVDWKSEVDPTQMAALGATFRYTKGKTPRTLDKMDEFYSGFTLSLGRIPGSSAEE